MSFALVQTWRMLERSGVSDGAEGGMAGVARLSRAVPCRAVPASIRAKPLWPCYWCAVKVKRPMGAFRHLPLEEWRRGGGEGAQRWRGMRWGGGGSGQVGEIKWIKTKYGQASRFWRTRHFWECDSWGRRDGIAWKAGSCVRKRTIGGFLCLFFFFFFDTLLQHVAFTAGLSVLRG